MENKGKQGRKTEWEEEKDLKERPFGGSKEETPLKLQENCLWRAFSPKKEQKQQDKHESVKKTDKIILFACWQTTPNFW